MNRSSTTLKEMNDHTFKLNYLINSNNFEQAYYEI